MKEQGPPTFVPQLGVEGKRNPSFISQTLVGSRHQDLAKDTNYLRDVLSSSHQ